MLLTVILIVSNISNAALAAVPRRIIGVIVQNLTGLCVTITVASK